MERIRKRARPEEKPISADYVRDVAQAYADFFFNYNEGPLLIVNASDIDFVGNAEHRRELISRHPERAARHQPLEPRVRRSRRYCGQLVSDVIQLLISDTAVVSTT